MKAKNTRVSQTRKLSKKLISPLAGILGLLKSEDPDASEAQRLRVEIDNTIKQIQRVGRRRDIPFEVYDLLYKLNESAGQFTWYEKPAKITVTHARPRNPVEFENAELGDEG